MDGVLIVTYRGGLLLYARSFAANFGLDAPMDPMNLSAFLFALQHNAAAVYEEVDAEEPPAPPPAGVSAAQNLRYIALEGGTTIDFAEWRSDAGGAPEILAASCTAAGYGDRGDRAALAIDVLERYVARYGGATKGTRAFDDDIAGSLVATLADRVAAVAAALGSPPRLTAGLLRRAPGQAAARDAALAAVTAAATAAAATGTAVAVEASARDESDDDDDDDDDATLDVELPLTARSGDASPPPTPSRAPWICCRRAAPAAAPAYEAPPSEAPEPAPAPLSAFERRPGGGYGPAAVIAGDHPTASSSAAAARHPPWLPAGEAVFASVDGGSLAVVAGGGDFFVAAPWAGLRPALDGAAAAALARCAPLGRFLYGNPGAFAGALAGRRNGDPPLRGRR